LYYTLWTSDSRGNTANRPVIHADEKEVLSRRATVKEKLIKQDSTNVRRKAETRLFEVLF
jgi:hypothetical protein